MGRIQRALVVPFLLLMVLAVACQPAAAPPKPAESKPAESKPAAAAPAATAAPSKPAESARPTAAAAKPAEAAKPAAAGKPVPGGTMRIAMSSEVTTLDPHLSTSSIDRQVYQSVYDTLVRLDKDLNVVPGLAKSWEQPDPKTVVFKLQSGVKYHDGEPFNAASVKANVERMKTHPKSLRKGELNDVVSVDVVDDLTVKFNLDGPSSPLLSLLTDRAGMMVSTKAADAAGDDFARKPVGTGPFKFVEWVKDDHITVKKWEQHWEKDADGVQLPYLDEVIYKPIPDGNQRLTAVRTNTVDMIDLPPSKDMPTLKKGTDLVYSEVPGLAYRYIQLNVKKAPLDNKLFRQAIAWSIDREAINKAIFFDVGQVGYQAIPPSSFAFDPDFKPYSPRNVAKAKELLAQSGVTDPTFTGMVPNTPDDKQLAEVFKEQLAESGITLEIELLENTVLGTRALKREYEASINGWSGRPDPDGNVFNFFHSKGAQNRSDYLNPEVDKLLEAARSTYDNAERKKLYSQANELILEDSPVIFSQHRPEVKVMTKKVQNFSHVPDGMMRLWSVWLQK
ncbi:MAG: ABC transporter substrate-binding protein [Chloroflexota bacterium]